MRPRSRRVLVVGLIAAVVAAGVVWAGRTWIAGRRARPLASVWSALEGARPIEGRIAGGLPYARYAPSTASVRRGSGGGRREDSRHESIDFMHAALDVHEADERAPSAETARGVAALHLLRGDAGAAIDRLDVALRGAGDDDPVLLNDLTVAYLEEARDEDRPALLVEALETVERALERSPELAEARFNRAVVLERLGIVSAARDAWGSYLAVDGESGWASEASERLAALERPSESAGWDAAQTRLGEIAATREEPAVREIVRQFPHFCRQHARRKLFPAWADATREGRAADAESAVWTARIIGDELVSLQGDNFVRDATAALDRASPRERERLVEAHLLERDAVAKSDLQLHRESVSLYARAAAAYTAGSDRAGELAALRNEADAFYNVLDIKRALPLVSRVRARADALGYPQLSGLAWWLAGTISFRERHLREAQQAYTVAATRLRATGFNAGEATVETYLAEVWASLGQEEEAYHHFLRGLSALREISSSSQRSTILHEFAVELTTRRRLSAALVVQNEAVRAAMERDDAFDLAIALHIRAVIYLESGHAELASADVAAARTYLPGIGDASMRARLEGDLLLTEVTSRMIEGPEAAAAACARVEEIYVGTEDRSRYLQSVTLHARSLARLGDLDGAQERMRAAVAEVQRIRRSISDADMQVTFFDAPQAVFDEMIRFQCLDRADPGQGLYYSEACRARTLLDLLGDRATDAPVTRRSEPLAERSLVADIQRQLAPDVTLLEYAWTGDDLFAWAIRRDGLEFRRLEAPSDLRTIIGSYRGALERGRWDDAAEAASRRLYDVLVRPIDGAVAGGDRLVVVPDDDLCNIPFATLRDRESGRFLVERVALTMAPSAEVFLLNAARDRAMARRGTIPALVIGNPRLDARALPGMPDLPNAEREARAVADVYPRSTILVGTDATKVAFIDDLEDATSVHFAGHAVTPGQEFTEPGLLFAGEGRDESFLGAGEIARLRLSSTRLVVLAACGTGVGHRVGREGNLSVARALLVAGVPCVAATFWSVEDQAPTAVLAEFHRKYEAGEAPDTALRLAMLAALASPVPEERSPAVWGAIYLLGGS